MGKDEADLQDLKTQLGRQLARLRNAKDLSQERLAELANLHWRTIQDIETGVYEPKFSTLVKLRKALGQSWDQLLTGF